MKKNVPLSTGFALLLLGFVLINSCDDYNQQVRGNGNIVSMKRNVAGFSQVSNGAPIDVILRPASSFSVVIKGDENLLRLIHLDKDGRRLKIRIKPGYSIRETRPLQIFIDMPELDYLSCAGSGNIETAGEFSTDRKFHVKVAGSGNIKAEIDAPVIEQDVAGSGNITVRGRTRDHVANIAGSGNINATKLLAESTKVNIAGSGDAYVYASIKLDAMIAGSGNVHFSGTPTVHRKVVGSGNIIAEE